MSEYRLYAWLLMGYWEWGQQENANVMLFQLRPMGQNMEMSWRS